MDDALEQRVDALERALTEGEHDETSLATETQLTDRLDTLESREDELADRVAELEAATQALRGYVGNIRSVNTDVEQQAEAALAKAEAVESAIDASAADSTETEPGQSNTQPKEQEQRAASNPQTRASADGGVSISAPSHPEHDHLDGAQCHACGRQQPDNGRGTPRKPATRDDEAVQHHPERTNERTSPSLANEDADESFATENTADRFATDDTANQFASDDSTDPFATDDPEDTGTLQRIRKLL